MAIIREKQLSEIWHEQRFDGTNLRTEDGRPLTIVYPGRLNDNRGGDFCDAMVSVGDQTLRGQVELHLKPSDWRAHGHHRDQTYNNVVLHVVYSQGNQVTTTLEDGREVPVLAIGRHVDSSAADSIPDIEVEIRNRPCRHLVCRRSETAVLRFIESSGESRFAQKSAAFELETRRSGPGQALYQGIMVALGYSRNKAPFLELSKLVPLERLESLARVHSSDEQCTRCLELVLLEAAGMLDSCDTGNGVSTVPSYVPRASGERTMSAADWHNFHARPSNSPSVRIAAMACLIARYRAKGLLQGLLDALIDAAPGKSSLLEDMVITTVSPGGRELLGRDRARDIIINVVLPFSNALGLAFGVPELCTKALSLYRTQPRSASNCIERHMTTQLGISRKVVNSARLQQGLLHIYSGLCKKGSCGDCWLGKLEPGDDVQPQPIPVTSQ